jgi:hypothetical protein
MRERESGVRPLGWKSGRKTVGVGQKQVVLALSGSILVISSSAGSMGPSRAINLRPVLRPCGHLSDARRIRVQRRPLLSMTGCSFSEVPAPAPGGAQLEVDQEAPVQRCRPLGASLGANMRQLMPLLPPSDPREPASALVARWCRGL